MRPRRRCRRGRPCRGRRTRTSCGCRTSCVLWTPRLAASEAGRARLLSSTRALPPLLVHCLDRSAPVLWRDRKAPLAFARGGSAPNSLPSHKYLRGLPEGAPVLAGAGCTSARVCCVFCRGHSGAGGSGGGGVRCCTRRPQDTHAPVAGLPGCTCRTRRGAAGQCSPFLLPPPPPLSLQNHVILLRPLSHPVLSNRKVCPRIYP